MFSNLKNILSRYKKKDLLAVDMDENGIRFVKILQNDQNKLMLDQYENFPFSKGGLGDRELESVKDFILSNNFQGMNAACNIEDVSLKIRRVEVPKMPDYDLVEAVKWEMREIVDGPIEEYAIRHSHLEEYTTGETQRFSLVAYAIHNEALERKVQLVKSLGLNPIIVEPNAVALLAAFDFDRQWDKGEYHVIVSLGWLKSLFVVVGQGKLYFSRPLEKVSVQQCLVGLRDAANLPEEEFLNLKNMCTHKGQKIGDVFKDSSDLQTILGRYFHQFSLELQGSIDSFSVMFHVDKISSMTLTGCGAFLPEIVDYFKKNMGVNTQVWKMSLTTGKNFENFDPYFSIAFGLGLPQEYS